MFEIETTSNSIATLLVCDNAIAHAGLTQILSGFGFKVADTLAAAPTLCLIDASKPSETILETVRAIKSQCPAIKVALLGTSSVTTLWRQQSLLMLMVSAQQTASLRF
jgi:CheY-like chemotaxis protein